MTHIGRNREKAIVFFQERTKAEHCIPGRIWLEGSVQTSFFIKPDARRQRPPGRSPGPNGCGAGGVTVSLLHPRTCCQSPNPSLYWSRQWEKDHVHSNPVPWTLTKIRAEPSSLLGPRFAPSRGNRYLWMNVRGPGRRVLPLTPFSDFQFLLGRMIPLQYGKGSMLYAGVPREGFSEKEALE